MDNVKPNDQCYILQIEINKFSHQLFCDHGASSYYNFGIQFTNISFLSGLIDKAFSCFSIPNEVVHLQKLSDKLNILELFHGPTWAFKDLALSCVGQFIDYFLTMRKKHVTILVGKLRYNVTTSILCTRWYMQPN